ncbi:MAG TPA: hypothetical protein VGX95_15335 [Xanthobacteraceae bacterium]|jgi:hypothetical protein|nr:hypothetical protein [Xanthobacteraceae bacterium]
MSKPLDRFITAVILVATANRAPGALLTSVMIKITVFQAAVDGDAHWRWPAVPGFT